MCVSIERELLAGNSRRGSMLSIAVGTSLVHRGVLKSDSECEVLCLDIREVNLIAGR